MAEVLVRFTEAIRDENGGSYRAQASGAIGADGLWEGWIEFERPDGSAVRTARETEQPNRVALVYWAEGLTVAYLEGALHRALDSHAKRASGTSADTASMSNDSPPEERRRSHPVLDPFASYAQGKGVLRRQLAALSRDHLRTIIQAYQLPVTVRAGVTEAELADEIAVAVNSLATTRDSQS